MSNWADKALDRSTPYKPKLDSSPKLVGRQKVGKGKPRNMSSELEDHSELRELASSCKIEDYIDLKHKGMRNRIKSSSNFSMS